MKKAIITALALASCAGYYDEGQTAMSSEEISGYFGSSETIPAQREAELCRVDLGEGYQSTFAVAMSHTPPTTPALGTHDPAVVTVTWGSGNTQDSVDIDLIPGGVYTFSGSYLRVVVRNNYSIDSLRATITASLVGAITPNRATLTVPNVVIAGGGGNQTYFPPPYAKEIEIFSDNPTADAFDINSSDPVIEIQIAAGALQKDKRFSLPGGLRGFSVTNTSVGGAFVTVVYHLAF
jgi:hypothetical protein